MVTPWGEPEGDENLEEALRREIKEETDCEIKSMTYFRSYLFKVDPGLRVRAIYFYGHISGSIELDDESSEYGWFGLEKIHAMDIAFNQKEVLQDYIKSR